MLFSKRIKNLLSYVVISLFHPQSPLLKEKKEYDFTNRIIVFTSLFILSFFTSLSASEDWQYYWHEGVELHAAQQYDEASTQFEIALNMMSTEEKDLFPFVMVSKIENDFILQNYLLVLEETQGILDSKELTDYERLICGIKRMSAFMKLENENAAVEEYKKYVVACPLLPTYHHSENKIIIRNMIDCNRFKTFIKQSMLTHFCKSEKDIHEHGNLWIVNITKTFEDNSFLTPRSARLKIIDGRDGRIRTLEQIEACCNTCDLLGAAAQAICGCLAVPEALAGPLAVVCTAGCIAFIECLKIDCKTLCKRQPGQYPNTFETWKDQFNTKYPSCPYPSCT